MNPGRALTRTVVIDGEVYGPGDVPPDHIAARIRNPQCWQTIDELADKVSAAMSLPENRSGRVPEPDPAPNGLRNLEPQPATTDSSAVAQPATGGVIGAPAAVPAPAPEPEQEPVDTSGLQANLERASAQPLLPEPPRSGRGATTAAWRAYAAQFDVEVPAEADRGDIIALLKDDGYIQ